MSLPFRQILRRPSLWAEAVRAGWAIRRRGTLAPNREYLAWRRETAYGRSDTAESPHDLAAYLRWRQRLRRMASS